MGYFIEFLTPLLVIFLAEIGDKTNLIALSLMVKTRHPYIVVVGSILGIGLTTALGVVIGMLIGQSLPQSLILFGSGILFLLFGIASLMGEQEEEDDNPVDISNSKKDAILKSIVLVGFAEIGDKSQLFVISSASTLNPVLVFLGALLAFTLVFVLTAVFGEGLLKKIPRHVLEISVSVIFILLGIFQIVSGIFSL